MRATDDWLRRLDDWRRQQTSIPARAEAIRQLVEIGIEATAKSKPPTPHGKRLPAG